MNLMFTFRCTAKGGCDIHLYLLKKSTLTFFGFTWDMNTGLLPESPVLEPYNHPIFPKIWTFLALYILSFDMLGVRTVVYRGLLDYLHIEKEAKWVPSVLKNDARGSVCDELGVKMHWLR